MCLHQAVLGHARLQLQAYEVSVALASFLMPSLVADAELGHGQMSRLPSRDLLGLSIELTLRALDCSRKAGLLEGAEDQSLLLLLRLALLLGLEGLHISAQIGVVLLVALADSLN